MGVFSSTPVSSGGHTVQEEGSPLTTRAGLNFVGTEVAATDDAANDRTNVTFRYPWWKPVAKTGYYHFPLSFVLATNGAVTLDRMTAVPLWLPPGVTADRITCHVGTAGSAGSVVRLGIYNPGSDGLPGTRRLDAGTVDSASTGQKEITLSHALPTDGGLVWMVAAPQVAAPSLYRLGAGTILPSGHPTPDASTAVVGFYLDGVTGALPDPFGTPTGSLSAGARVGVRLA